MKHTPTIFLAEDSDADVFLIREALSGAGLECALRRERDGEAALRAIEQMDREGAPIDCALLDLNLPRVSGLDLIKRVRLSQHYVTTPIIVVTSSNAPADRRSAVEQGVDYYFRKPTSLNDFLLLGELVRKSLLRADL